MSDADPAGRASDDAMPQRELCGAKNRQNGKPCRRPAGWGTDHPGIGNCKNHTGSTPNGRRHAALERGRREALRLSELRHRPVDPHEALLEEVHRTAGMVSFLEGYLAAGSTEDLTQLDLSGKFERPSVWYELYERERKHLVDAARACIAAGVEERQVAVAESQGRLLAGAVRRILERLGLAEDPAALEVARAELLALNATVEATATTACRHPHQDGHPEGFWTCRDCGARIVVNDDGKTIDVPADGA